MWLKTGTVAINGWEALSAHDGIVAKDKKETVPHGGQGLCPLRSGHVDYLSHGHSA